MPPCDMESMLQKMTSDLSKSVSSPLAWLAGTKQEGFKKNQSNIRLQACRTTRLSHPGTTQSATSNGPLSVRLFVVLSRRFGATFSQSDTGWHAHVMTTFRKQLPSRTAKTKTSRMLEAAELTDQAPCPLFIASVLFTVVDHDGETAPTRTDATATECRHGTNRRSACSHTKPQGGPPF